MRRKDIRSRNWNSVFSILGLIVFGFIGLGSPGSSEWQDSMDRECRIDEEGEFDYTEKNAIDSYIFFEDGDKLEIITTGPKNKYGHWHGKITNKFYDRSENEHWYTEEINMVNGYKNGMAKVTYYPDGNVEYICYAFDDIVDCNKSTAIYVADKSAFQYLQSDYPMYKKVLNVYNFGDVQIEEYLINIEASVREGVFDVEDFDDNYDDAEVGMEDTKDSMLIKVDNYLTLWRRSKMLLKNEFRMANIDRARAGDVKISDIIENNYPGYYQKLINGGVTENKINEFCNEFDSRMDNFPELDLEDPFFTDSLDSRMISVFYDLYEASSETGEVNIESKSASLSGRNLSNWYLKKLSSQVLQYLSNYENSNDVLMLVMGFMSEDVYEGDILRMCVRKAYMESNGILESPGVVTLFNEVTSVTAVNIIGEVTDDGGDDITSRGIVWGTTYNPTVDDNKIESGSGMGEFLVEITGLSEDQTYYARAFAVNSVGIAYGNCVEFSASDFDSGDDDDNNSGNEVKTIIVTEWGGAESRFSIANIRKLVFDLGSLNIVKHDNGSNLVELEGLRNLKFSDVKVGIDKALYCECKTFKIYPNPVKNIMNVDFSEEKNILGNLILYDIEGSVVVEYPIENPGIIPINLEHLSPGTYICRYANDGEVKTVKIIKK